MINKLKEILKDYECSIGYNPGGTYINFEKYGHYQLLNYEENLNDEILNNLKLFLNKKDKTNA
jgi:hypothetical protein